MPISACIAKWDRMLVIHMLVNSDTLLVTDFCVSQETYCKGHGYHRYVLKKLIQKIYPEDAVRYEGLLSGGHWKSIRSITIVDTCPGTDCG